MNYTVAWRSIGK